MQERNYGIDFLRVISMFMIVILHILGNGGILASVQTGSSTYHASWLMEIALLQPQIFQHPLFMASSYFLYSFNYITF